MDINDIDKIVASVEGNTIEFKEAQYTLPSSIYETVVSFSNTEGGTILLGIDKNGIISGIDTNELENIQKWLNLPETILPHFEEGLSGIQLAPELGENGWEHLNLNLVPSWHKNGTELPVLKWPKNQLHTIEKIKNVPSWVQNSTQLLTKKVWYLVSILLLVSKPLRLSELVNVFNYRNHTYFRENYLIPIRNAGLIAFTNPEK